MPSHIRDESGGRPGHHREEPQNEFDRAGANCEIGITGPGDHPGGQPRITGEINRGGTVGIHAVRSRTATSTAVQEPRHAAALGESPDDPGLGRRRRGHRLPQRGLSRPGALAAKAQPVWRRAVGRAVPGTGDFRLEPVVGGRLHRQQRLELPGLAGRRAGGDQGGRTRRGRVPQCRQRASERAHRPACTATGFPSPRHSCLRGGRGGRDAGPAAHAPRFLSLVDVFACSSMPRSRSSATSIRP